MGRLHDRMESDLKLKRLSEGTRKQYLSHAKRFAAHFMRPPEEMGEEQIRAYLHHLVEVEHASVPKQKMALAALKFLYAQTLGRPDEVARIPWPKVPFELPEVLSHDELARLLASADAGLLRTAFLTAYAAGLRVSEVCRLKAADVDGARGVIRVNAGKGGKDRLTLLSPRLLAVLRSWWKEERPGAPTGYVFPGGEAGHVSRRLLQQSFVLSARRVSIRRPVRFHTLRHSFATHMLEAGVDIRVIQAVLGHKDIKTTTRYAQVRVDHIASLPDPLALLGW